MKQRVSLLLGVFAIMALSNAIVPILPRYAYEAPALQGIIFSAYFFGAFATVIPAGILSDRIGRVLLIRTGLLLTLLSGCILILFQDVAAVVGGRLIEGIAAGLFISSALSWVNSQEDHSPLSGYFFAALNGGLVIGLLVAGWLTPFSGFGGGIVFFTGVAALPLLLSIFLHEAPLISGGMARIGAILVDYKWLFFSGLVIIGITGVATSLYPEFTDESPLMLSIQIGTMNVATVIASLLAPRFHMQPIPAIRMGAFVMAGAAVCAFFAPQISLPAVLTVFAVMGGIAGIVIISQMEFLAATKLAQGTVMGLFNASSYAGMTFLPFIAGVIAQECAYSAAFFSMAALAVIAAATIGRCGCAATQEMELRT